MGLIEKLEEIKTKVENLPSGGGGTDSVDYTDTNGSYMCYSLSNKNLVNFLCDNMNKSNVIDYTRCFYFCKSDVSDFFKPHTKYREDVKASGYGYPFGVKYYLYHFDSTFYSYRHTGTLTLDIGDYPIYSPNLFYDSSIKELNTKTGEMWIGDGNKTFQRAVNLESIPVIKIDGCLSLINCFNGCKNLKTIEFKGRPGDKDYSKLQFNGSSQTFSFGSCFTGCTLLESVKNLDVSYIVSSTSTSSMFSSCTSLTELDFTGSEDFKINIDISKTALTREGLLNMLNTMPVSSTTPTITIGSTKMALLTEEDIALFTEKGYTLA